jgi:ATP-dependent Clp endopeptidase proteolytic subunit ClpP
MRELELAKIEAEIASIDAEREMTERRLVESDCSDSANRVYRFTSAVGQKSVLDCIRNMQSWSRQYPGKPMTLVIDSPGGSVLDGLHLFDFLLSLRAQGHHITTLARGMAASMGGVILQAGDLRVVSPSCYVLIHEISSGTGGKTSEIEDDLKFTKRLQSRLLDILAERSTLSKEKIATRWKKTDWWLDAAQSVELGFADEVES